MAKMSKEAMGLFRDPEASKVLATVDVDGMPNMAPKGSLVALDEGTLAFAIHTESSTKTNLDVSSKVSAAAFKWGAGCQVKGIFQGFQTSGPLYEQFSDVMTKVMGTPTRWISNVEAVGIIKVQRVS